jgi:hypothetical protein
MKRAHGLLLSLSLAACSAPPPAGALGQAIINGTVDDADTNVVLVFAQVPGQSTGSLCTGEIVSPHVVMTAAHCMAPSTVGAGAKFTIFTGTALPASGPPPANELLAVSESHFNPTFAYSPTTGSDMDDIGVLILAAPTTIAPLPFNHYTLPASAKGGPARIVGYGLTDGNDTQGTTAGTRHEAPTTLFNFYAQTVTLYDNSHSNCEGDSGGPALVMLDGKERIAGITQVGYVHCPVDMASTDTRVDAYASFVDPYITMFDPPPVAAGGACTSESDCGALECIGGVCAAPCDPAAMTSSCPSGTECLDVDGKSLCGKAHHGCAMGGTPITDGSALFLFAALPLLARRRRRA